MPDNIQTASDYPVWICSSCGAKYGKRRCGECATWHIGKCGICGIEACVTEPRDFGHLQSGFGAYVGLPPRDVHDLPDGPSPKSGSGRTQWMIDQLCDAVAIGQPKCMVYGHTMDFALNYLKPRVIEGLQRRGLQIDRVGRERLDVEGSVIVFTSTSLPNECHRGFRGFGDFVDHYADGEM